MAKILVFDPDVRFREVVKAALASLGHETVLSPDGYSVLPLAERHRPSLFILDHMPPESDGCEILQRLRAAPAFAAAPVIFASAVPRLQIEMTLMGASGVAYVDKPLDGRQLREALADLLGPEAAAAPAAPAAAPAAQPPGEPSPPASFTGEPDLDGSRDDVINLD